MDMTSLKYLKYVKSLIIEKVIRKLHIYKKVLLLLLLIRKEIAASAKTEAKTGGNKEA
jgi:hypothetical protein